MARIRTIKPEFWSSPDTASCEDPWARLLFIGMWNFADDNGRGTAHPKELAGNVFPLDEKIDATDVRRMMVSVQVAFGVRFYQVSGRPYYAIPSWNRHQKIDNRSRGKYPPPEEGTDWDPDPGSSAGPAEDASSVRRGLDGDSTVTARITSPEDPDNAHASLTERPVGGPPTIPNGSDHPNVTHLTSGNGKTRRDPPRVRRGLDAPSAQELGELGELGERTTPLASLAVSTDHTGRARDVRTPTAARDAAFVEFWSAYPRKVGKGAAAKAFGKALGRGAEPSELISAVRAYARSRTDEDPEFTPYPATWLNQDRYLDPAPEPRAGHMRKIDRTANGGFGEGTTAERMAAIQQLKRGTP